MELYVTNAQTFGGDFRTKNRIKPTAHTFSPKMKEHKNLNNYLKQLRAKEQKTIYNLFDPS